MSASEWPPTTSLIDWMVDWIAVVVVGERAPALSEPRAAPPPPPAMPAARGEIARTHAGTGERVVVEALAIAAGIASNDARPLGFGGVGLGFGLVAVVGAGQARWVRGFPREGKTGKKL